MSKKNPAHAAFFFDTFLKSVEMKNLMMLLLIKFKITNVFVAFVFILVLILYGLSSQAQGDLLLYPKRIVFEGNTRMQVVNLVNTGKDTVIYRISVVQIRMLENGTFETITEPDSAQQFADPFFRFFPRQVLLPPNKAQTVKIQLYNTNDLKPGEYRSHIYLRAEPDKKPLGEDDKIKETQAIAVKVVAVFGISIPVIIRVGESTTKLSITNAQLETVNNDMDKLKVEVMRTGNMSVYGDIAVNHISNLGKITQVGIIKGMALYAPYEKRIFEIPIKTEQRLNLHQGKLHITYSTQPDAKSVVLAETDLLLK